MSTATLPPLTGSALFDPWRLRYRELLVHGGAPEPARRPTRSEVLLWEALQGASRTWVAEFPTRYGYRLDFFCPEVRLAIEVDGPSHWGRFKAERDEWRDLVHCRMGIQTRRFSAGEVERDVTWVAREIARLTEERASALAGVAAEPALQGPASTDELDDDERVLLFPAEPAGWSAYVPACRTVLPEGRGRRTILDVLVRSPKA